MIEIDDVKILRLQQQEYYELAREWSTPGVDWVQVYVEKTYPDWNMEARMWHPSRDYFYVILTKTPVKVEYFLEQADNGDLWMLEKTV